MTTNAYPLPVSPQTGDLAVYWIPNPPRAAYHYPIESVDQAKLVLDVLAHYDLYLDEDIISANYGGLVVWDGTEWVDWESDDCEDINEIRKVG